MVNVSQPNNSHLAREHAPQRERERERERVLSMKIVNIVGNDITTWRLWEIIFQPLKCI